MPSWMRFDIDKTTGIFHKKPKQPQYMSLTIGCEEMQLTAFEYIVENFLSNISYSEESFLSIGYETDREDNVSCIQAYKQPNGLYYVEIIKRFVDNFPFHAYVKYDLTIEEALDYFEEVLIGYSCPDVSSWEDDTLFQLKQM